MILFGIITKRVNVFFAGESQLKPAAWTLRIKAGFLPTLKRMDKPLIYNFINAIYHWISGPPSGLGSSTVLVLKYIFIST